MANSTKNFPPTATLKDRDQALKHIQDHCRSYIDPSDGGYISNFETAVLDLQDLLLPDTEDSLFGLQSALNQERYEEQNRRVGQERDKAGLLTEAPPQSDVLQHVVEAAAALLEIDGQDETSHSIAVWALKHVATTCSSTIDGAPVVIAAARLLARVPDTPSEAT